LWIYGPTGTKHFVKTIMKLVTTLPKELETYPYEINIVELPRKFFTIKVNDELLITTAPLKHVKLDLGIRLDFVKENRSLIYTGDTSPCKNAVRLSNDGSILIADCNFEDTPETSRYSILRGHCTSRQAAKIALDANVKSLYLTHLHGTRYGVKDIATKIIAEASEVFHGNVYYPDDLDSFSITTGLKNESMSHNCSETSINRDRG
jgi:ribonuclease BN (tRNA processing enzyme)